MCSFTQIINQNNGLYFFLSDQATITRFLKGPQISNFEGVCLALVIFWLRGNTSTTNPLEGTKNRVQALQLQDKMETKWDGSNTVRQYGTEEFKKDLWWSSESLISFATPLSTYVTTQIPANSDSLWIMAIYFKSGSGHALGIWRYSPEAFAFYDPNYGACAFHPQNLDTFITSFISKKYPTATGYALWSWLRKKDQ